VNIATPPIWKFGTEEQKQRWLVPAIKGEKIGALGITEPDAGSDVASIRTHAKRVDGGWIVNGSKTFITNGVRADFVVTAVKTTPTGGHRGLSFLVAEKGMDGFMVSRKLEKLGWHASDTGELAFQDVFVPDENLLGEENQGFYLIMANFQWERLGMALGAVAKQQYLLERALAYVNERSAFGRPLAKFQVTRHKIAEIALRAEAGRALTYNALRLFVSGHDALRETTMAKLLTQRDCVRTADDVVQLFGGNGYMAEYEVERSLRDARLGPIGGGSDEIMREILSRQLGL
jgi:acyl-CoA dehydrogenase